MRILKSIAVWFLILLGAIANGVLREAVLLPRLGTKPAYVLSGVLLGLVILGVTLGCIRWLGVQSQQQAARNHGCDACPHRDIDRFLLFDRKLDRPQLHRRCVFGVAKATIDQGEDSAKDERYCDEFDGIQVSTSHSGPDRQCRRR